MATSGSRVAAFCSGDCNDDGSVEASEADVCENLLLNGIPTSGNPCPNCDCNEDGAIAIAELTVARGNVAQTCNEAQCPPPTPTAQPIGTPVPTATGSPTIEAEPTATASPSQPPLETATSTPSNSPETSPTAPVATVTATAVPPSCVGDCDGGGNVSINELLQGVNIALGNRELTACPAFDRNNSLEIEISELISAVSNALNACG